MAEKRVVITGSTKGIGRGLAEEFIKNGCCVVVSSRKPDAVEETVAALELYGSERAAGTTCDVTEPGSIDGLWRFAVDAFGGVDIWINNAGIGSNNRFLADTGAVDIRRMVETNLLGTLFGCRTATDGMRKTGGIVCVMEGFGSDGMTRPSMNVYGATKRAVRYLARGLSKEVRGTRTAIVAISPGMVKTDLLVGDLGNRPSAERNRLERFFSILADDVATVSPFIVRRLLAGPKNGERIAWLTRSKTIGRFIVSPWRISKMRPRLFRR